MSAIPDYLENLGATIQWRLTYCRILCKDQSAIFPYILPITLRRKFNKAMHGAIAYYTRHVEKSEVVMERRHVDEASFQVVLYTLYIYNQWRSDGTNRSQPLEVAPADLGNAQSLDQCWHYCEKEFGADYQRYAATLTGMTLDEFKRYERGRREFADLR